jgi:hypothetical protein
MVWTSFKNEEKTQKKALNIKEKGKSPKRKTEIKLGKSEDRCHIDGRKNLERN